MPATSMSSSTCRRSVQTVREYFAVIDWLEAQFGRHVDVLMLDTLRPRFRRAIERDIVWIDL